MAEVVRRKIKQDKGVKQLKGRDMLEQDFLGKMIWWPAKVELAGVRGEGERQEGHDADHG